MFVPFFSSVELNFACYEWFTLSYYMAEKIFVMSSTLCQVVVTSQPL